MGNSEHLFETIFKRNLTDGDPRDFLTELVNEHPYFTAAQFYLLQQTDKDATDYTKQAAKTSILFNNSFWLEYQLSQTITPTFTSGQNVIIDKEIAATAYNKLTEQPENTQPVFETNDTGLTAKETGLPEKIAENEKQTGSNTESVVNTLTPVAVQQIEANTLSPEEAGTTLELPDIDVQEEMYPSKQIIENETIAEVNIKPIDSLTAIALQQTGETVEENYTEQQYLEDKEQPEDESATDEKEIEPMNIKLNFTSATATTEDTISFEPLHTSDYFASVGIKFSDDVKPGDKLGKQLKSFTDWLKTMKKIHTDQLPVQSEQSVISIQKMAEQSNTEDEVLTEAMAEVFLQQGKNGKAIEVYKKLSLLNPSKSAYFAAKIDHIKN